MCKVKVSIDSQVQFVALAVQCTGRIINEGMRLIRQACLTRVVVVAGRKVERV